MFCPNCGKENEPSDRYCKACGSFIPDLSGSAGGNVQDQLSFSETTEAPQPMTYQALSENDINAMQNDTSRYQEYTMSDVVARKSKKKMIIAICVIAGVIALGVASFFIIRAIINNNAIGSIQEDPTKYVMDSYRTTAEDIKTGNLVSKSVPSLSATQRTIRAAVTVPQSTQTAMCSVDLDSKKFYSAYETEMTLSDEMKKYYSGPEKLSAELYADPEKAVANLAIDKDKFDYYLELDGLREKAEKSMFGPKGENILHLDQKTYDTAMDVYEFIYKNIMQSDDPFGIFALGTKLRDDFNKYSTVTVAQEKVVIDTNETDAYVITHSFNDANIIVSLADDIKEWIKTNVRINSEIDSAIDSALEKIDVNQLLAQLNSNAQNVGIEFRHYVNKDNALMQTELYIKANGQGFVLTLTFGADPATSNRMTLKVSAKTDTAESVLQSVTFSNESTAAQEKFVTIYSGLALTGNTTYTRDLATGDFTIDNSMSSPMASLSGGSSDIQVPSGARDMMNFSYSGNIKTTEDSVTVKLFVPYSEGSQEGVSYEYYVSGKAEIKELTSNNDLLKAKSEDFTKLFGKFMSPSVTLA